MKAFHANLSQAHKIPIVVSVPHVGLDIPNERDGLLTLPREVLLCDVDFEVQQIWESSCRELDITMIWARYHRYAIDLNRAPVLSEDTKGLFWMKTTMGDHLGPGGAPFEALTKSHADLLIKKYWKPYYDFLDRELKLLKKKHHKVILIDGHSMPSVATALHPDKVGSRRADIVPGDLKGKSCDPQQMQLLNDVAHSCGYQVARNDPYSGGNITRHFANPDEQIFSLQIEINRALYMNEKSKQLKPDGLKKLQKFARQFLNSLRELMLLPE